LLLCILISILPFNGWRIFFYNLLFNYKISKSSKIGLFTIIMAKNVRIEDSEIASFNFIRGPFDLEIEQNVKIGPSNKIECGTWILEDKFRDCGYLACCKLRKNSLITDKHFLDVTGGFELGEYSWIAGRESQFWTHGAGVKDRSIKIGKHCYIGTAARFAPGTAIADDTTVSLGSVVIDKFSQNNCLLGGIPAKVIMENYISPIKL